MRKRIVGCHPSSIERLFKADNLGLLWQSWNHATASVLPYCDDPVWITLQAKRARRDLSDLGGHVLFDLQKGGGTLALDMAVPCRRCNRCLWVRAKMYADRIIRECEQAHTNADNSYFVTLTFRSGERVRLWREACALSGSSEPSARCRAKPVIRNVAAFVRRLRARNKRLSGCRIRYASVIEYHQSGDPHIHLVVHGRINSKHIRAARWGLGYIHIRKIHPGIRAENTARYIAKYLGKSLDFVATNSKLYGKLTYRPIPGMQGAQEEFDETPLGFPVQELAEWIATQSQLGPSVTDPPKKEREAEELFSRYLLRIQKQVDLDVEGTGTAEQLALALNTEACAPSRLSFPTPKPDAAKKPPSGVKPIRPKRTVRPADPA